MRWGGKAPGRCGAGRLAGWGRVGCPGLSVPKPRRILTGFLVLPPREPPQQTQTCERRHEHPDGPGFRNRSKAPAENIVSAGRAARARRETRPSLRPQSAEDVHRRRHDGSPGLGRRRIEEHIQSTGVPETKPPSPTPKLTTSKKKAPCITFVSNLKAVVNTS